MTNALLSYQFDDTPVRIVMVAGDPWFVANDVAKALGYREAYDMCRNLDDDEKGSHNISTLGGDQSVNIISESGLYAAVLKSRKEEAKRFRKWVTGEVLPSLRKTGQYLMHDIEPAPMQSIDFDPSRLAVGVSVIREARRLWGPVAARNLWAQVGLPPCVLDSEAVFDGDPIAMPLKAYLTGKVETTIQQAAEGMGIDNVDMSTRFRIGKLLAMWGWVAKNRKVSKNRTARIFSRPAASVILDQAEA